MTIIIVKRINNKTVSLYALHCKGTEGNELLIPGMLHLATSQIPILVLIDTGCRQTNVVSARIAATMRAAKSIRFPTPYQRSGEQSYGVNGIMNVNISLASNKIEARGLLWGDVSTDLIVAFRLLSTLTDSQS